MLLLFILVLFPLYELSSFAFLLCEYLVINSLMFKNVEKLCSFLFNLL